LRHASAWNVIECFFGIVKQRFCILTLAPEFDMGIQARLPPALCALHNFILRYDPDDLEEMLDTFQDPEHEDVDYGNLASGPSTREARQRSETRRDEIAQQMWDDYVALLAVRAGE
jgi:hypothetical protein